MLLANWPGLVASASLLLGVLVWSTRDGSGQSVDSLKSYIPRLEKNLRQDIVPFWLSKSLDRKNGGYLIDIGVDGEAKLPGTKMIVTQSRQVWFWSRLAMSEYGNKECLEAADLGYRFLRDKMWDRQNGGFYWEVDSTGNTVLKANKHLYGQGFALYALSRYYLASGRKDVLDFATRIFDLLESKAHDRKNGGYVESFVPDWSRAPDERDTYLGTPTGLKLMNTHLHLMEAVSEFYRASKLPLARERLLELITIESNSVVRKGLTACTDKYEPDWTPRLDGSFARVSYGHDIENVWLLMDACDSAGISIYPYMDLNRGLWDYTLKYGFDADQGGIYDSGPFNATADNKDKVWWGQAEVIVSALCMYRITRDPKYISIFQKSYDFIDSRLTDWKVGEWHERVTAAGKGIGDKASPWKAAYHNGRSMIECLTLLKELTRK